MKKVLKFKNTMIMKEEYRNRIGGRKAYTIGVCTGCKKISLISVTLSFNFWR